jgi:hypothetical protein
MELNQLPTWSTSNPWGNFFVAFQGYGLRYGQQVLLRPLVDPPLAILGYVLVLLVGIDRYTRVSYPQKVVQHDAGKD